LFIGILEDTGYMARAAFLMDRLMSKVGLHGKSFIPCSVHLPAPFRHHGHSHHRESEGSPGHNPRCPINELLARLPVYTVLIAACVPDRKLFGFLKLSGLTMLSMYLLESWWHCSWRSCSRNVAQGPDAHAHHGIASV
jgi:ferrous iron transport protein B